MVLFKSLAFFRLVCPLPLHQEVKINEMGIKFRPVHAGKPGRSPHLHPA
jgi:hypothetical protein